MQEINDKNKNGDCYVIAYREQEQKDILVHGLATPVILSKNYFMLKLVIILIDVEYA